METLKKQCLQMLPVLILCALLLGGRFYASDSWLFAFLVWNLFLAFLPWALSWSLREIKSESKLIFCFLFFSWLFFFPNAPYLITDFFHLKPRNIIPIWYDTLLFMAYAWAGVLFGIWSLQNIQKVLEERWKSFWKSHAALFFLCLLSGFGIFLGRFLRFNTWDIVFDPLKILQIGFEFFERIENIYFALLFSGAWGLFIWTTYISLSKRKTD